MEKTFVISKNQKPTPEQIMEVKLAKSKPIVFDEDCEELSPAMIKAFECVAPKRSVKKA